MSWIQKMADVEEPMTEKSQTTTELVDNERELENKYWLHPFEIGVMKERRIEHSRKQLRVCWLFHDNELGVTVGGDGDVEDHFTGSPMK